MDFGAFDFNTRLNTRLANDYPFVIECANIVEIEANFPIPLYVATIDLSQRQDLLRVKNEYENRCIDPNSTSSTPLLQVPTVTMNGAKFDIRTMSKKQIQEFESARIPTDLPARIAKTVLTTEYPFFLELGINTPVPTNMSIPLYVPTVDHTNSKFFLEYRMCQQHHVGGIIGPNEKDDGDPQVQVPTIQVSGKKYDVRTMTADQIDLLQVARSNGNRVEEASFLQAGQTGRMHERLSSREIQRTFNVDAGQQVRQLLDRFMRR